MVFSSRGLITGEVVDGSVVLLSTPDRESAHYYNVMAMCVQERTCRITFLPVAGYGWLRDLLLDLQLDP
jgi:hypothetical protein